jgi:diguanylate cyclase (GGDEF)-like protein
MSSPTLQELEAKLASATGVEKIDVLNSLALELRLGDPARALTFATDAHALSEAASYNGGLARSLLAFASCQYRLAQFELARADAEQALRLFQDLNDQWGKASSMNILGGVYENLAEYPTAVDYYRKSLGIFRDLTDREGEAESLLYLGQCYTKVTLFRQSNDYQDALASLNAALTIAAEIQTRELVYQIYQALAETYKLAGDFKTALQHYETFHAIEKDVLYQTTDNKIRQLQIIHQVEQAKKEADLRRTEAELRQKEAEAYRLKNVELAEANEALRRSDALKSSLLDKLRMLSKALERQAKEDGLTGLLNRRYLDILLAQEFERARRFGHQLTVALCDIDLFKTINDRFSHQTGDDVLRAMAKMLRESCRAIDIVARYGGEEFVLILPETPPESGMIICEKLRKTIEDFSWSDIHPDLKVTMSIGISGDLSVADFTQLLALADAKLYEAKRNGRNQVRA